MKFLFNIILMLSLSFVYAVNLIPNGDLSVSTGNCPKPRKARLSTAVYQKGEDGTNKIMVNVVAKDTPIIDVYGISGLEAGKRYFLRVDFTALSMVKEANVSARISFYDGQKKNIRNFFSPLYTITQTGKQEMIYSFNAPAAAITASVAIFFNGIQKTEVSKLSLDTEFPLLEDGNAIWNGSFESLSMNGIRLESRANGKKYTSKNTQIYMERSANKAKSGNYSLLCYSEFEKSNNEIFFHMLPFREGAKYRFTANYFIASGAGKLQVAGRISFYDKNGKEIRNMFPSGNVAMGKWEKLEREFYPPAGTARISVTLWLIGKMQIYLDDVYFGEVTEQKMENRTIGATLLVNSNDFKLWKETPFLKVAYSGVPQGIKAGKGISISAAANESEPFQLVVSPQRQIPALHLLFSDLSGNSGVIPAKYISSRVVSFINLKKPDIPTMKGWNADPILPEGEANGEKDRNLPFYVSVKVPKAQKAGVYNGTIKVMSGATELAKVPLSVRVRNFALPDIAHLRTYFYGQPLVPYRSIDKRPWSVIADDLLRMNYEHRMNGNQALGPANPVCTIENGTLIVKSWSEFDKSVERWNKEFGVINIPVPFFPMLGYNSGWSGKENRPRKIAFGNYYWDTPEGLKYMGEFAKQFTQHVKEKFPHINFYAYMYDEPKADAHAQLRKITNAIHQAAPDLKIFITKDGGGDIGYIHTLCSPLSPGLIDYKKHSEIVKNGGDVWFYNWQVHMDNHRYIMARLYPWMIYSIDGNGGLLWNTIATRMNVNPWNDMDKTYECGAATIFYPPRFKGDRLVSSLRAQQIRESIDDFDYMRILEKKIDALYPGVGKIRVKEIIRELIPVFPFEYKNDPHLLYLLRSRIADEIEALNSELQAVVVSTPMENTQTKLSEVVFHVYAPAGSQVSINGKAAGIVSKNRSVDLPFNLDRNGENQVSLVVALNGKKARFIRKFTRVADPQIKELQQLYLKCRKQGVDISEIPPFLKNVAQSRVYTKNMRSKAAELLQNAKFAMVSKRINSSEQKFANPLEKVIFSRAKAAFGREQFERANYYLSLAAEAGKAGSMELQQVKINATDYMGHAAFVLDNGIIQATILETGGRVISFKVNNIECLSPGSFKNGLSLHERSAQKVNKEMVTRLHGYGGYEDAGGRTLWPISFVDWDMQFVQLKPDCISLKFMVHLPESPFKLCRTLSMHANSSDLKMDYEFVNVMPDGIKSDDPEHYQLQWRGRLVPAIGNESSAQENDKLVIPVKNPDDALTETCFQRKNPIKFERASIRLRAPYAGVFDAQNKSGLALIANSQITHAYVWFDSKSDKGVYTLEFPRSFYGKSTLDKEANTPFTILPGKSIKFSLTLRGVSGVKNQEEFLQKAGL